LHLTKIKIKNNKFIS